MKYLVDTSNSIDINLELSEEELDNSENSDEEFAFSIASLCMEYMSKRYFGLCLPIRIKLTKLIEEDLKELFNGYRWDSRMEREEKTRYYYKEILYKKWLSGILFEYNMDSESAFLEWLDGRDCDIDCWSEGSIFCVAIVDFDKSTMAYLGFIEVDIKKRKSEKEIHREIDDMISIATVLMDKLYGKGEFNPLRSYDYEFIYNEFIEFQESFFDR